MPMSASTLKLIRQIHLYFGVLIAPALLFFAFTGALQTFSLHETTQGSTYKPPAWIATLAQIHKKETATIPPRKPRPTDSAQPNPNAKPPRGNAPTATPTPATPPAAQPKQKSHLPLKIFFLIVSIGLFTSTITGIVMAYMYTRNKLVITALLIAGLIIPLLLLPF